MDSGVVFTQVSVSPQGFRITEQPAAGQGLSSGSLSVFPFGFTFWLYMVFWCCAALPVHLRYVVKESLLPQSDRLRKSPALYPVHSKTV